VLRVFRRAACVEGRFWKTRNLVHAMSEVGAALKTAKIEATPTPPIKTARVSRRVSGGGAAVFPRPRPTNPLGAGRLARWRGAATPTGERSKGPDYCTLCSCASACLTQMERT
jgi:hypothetical protein